MAIRRILSIDPGITSGWCIVEVDDQLNVKVVEYGEIPVLATGLDNLLLSVWGWLNNMWRRGLALTFHELVFEGPLNIYGSMTQTELHEVRGIIRLWAAFYEVPHADYHPMVVKKAVTGSAKGTKNEVAAAVRGFFDLPKLPTDHVSDALAIALTHLGGIDGPDSGLHPGKRESAAQAVKAAVFKEDERKRAKAAKDSATQTEGNRATRRANNKSRGSAIGTRSVQAKPPTKPSRRGSAGGNRRS